MKPTRWTVNPLLFHDNETGKPIGTEYWVLDADGEDIACFEDEATAKLFAAAPETAAERDRLQTENNQLTDLLVTAAILYKESEIRHPDGQMWVEWESIAKDAIDRNAVITSQSIGELSASIVESINPLVEIYGSEVEFNLKIPRSQVVEKCKEIWDHPSKYSGYVDGSSEAYYEFLKFLWVKDGDSDERLTDFVKM